MPRTRPQHTIQRDQQVYDALKQYGEAGVARKDLAAALGWEEKHVYASLTRLRRNGGYAAKEDGKNVWRALHSDADTGLVATPATSNGYAQADDQTQVPTPEFSGTE